MSSTISVNAYTHIFRQGVGPRTLILLHGTGGDEHDLLPLGPMLDPGASILSPRGNVLESGMPRFFKRFAEGVFDLDDVRRRARELNQWLDAAALHYGLERTNFIAAGFSNGANIAAAMMTQIPGSLAGAILIRAMHTIDPQATTSLSLGALTKGEGRGEGSNPPGLPPSSPAPSPSPSTLLLTGDSDPIVSAQSANNLDAALTSAGVHVDHRRLPAGHTLTRSDVDAAAAWLGSLGGRNGRATT